MIVRLLFSRRRDVAEDSTTGNGGRRERRTQFHYSLILKNFILTAILRISQNFPMGICGAFLDYPKMIKYLFRIPFLSEILLFKFVAK